MSNKLEKVGNILEGYNKTFDTVSALAAYKALVENGVDSKQAAATTLELTNFRKTGSKMRGIKALYMFSQPAVMGAANLMRYLSTRKGQYRFAAYLAGMTALYTVLRSMDDEDEGGIKWINLAILHVLSRFHLVMVIISNSRWVWYAANGMEFCYEYRKRSGW
ncbi:hypothetical protein CGSHiR3021_00122 [Haemophilus influenzae 22.4-21]|uniref:Uncharacterized protein n=1 Tax=Haemophilus influenzae 22.4-21 TaxID=375063 RepID=A4P193_HAEIF|nr:hypothetical protein CGSHiR3021_00122 [Haemophilus influenzae 22.4-21]